MSIRRIKGASADLYDLNSNAHHRAIERLAGVLRCSGYKVVKKTARERTLRVYPEKFFQYPLLNPYFGCEVVESKGKDYLLEFLYFNVYSSSGRAAIDLQRYLNKSSLTYPCGFITTDSFDSTTKPLVYHGRLFVGILFADSDMITDTDFEALEKPLRKLWRFLDNFPAGKSKMIK